MVVIKELVFSEEKVIELINVVKFDYLFIVIFFVMVILEDYFKKVVGCICDLIVMIVVN